MPKARVPQGGIVEDVGHQREISFRMMAKAERETGKQITQEMAELEERRSAAIAASTAAVQAEYNEIGRRKRAPLRNIEAFEEGRGAAWSGWLRWTDLGGYH